MPTEDISTRFPFISLEKAIARAQLIFNGDKSGKAMSVVTAFELWSYSSKSSGGFQTISALKMFGLIDDEGANSDRKVKLTSKARRFFLDERDDIRNAMLEEFALNPPLFKVLWERDGWSDGIPADTVARSHLKVERGLNEQSSRALLSILKESLHYAGVKPGASPTEITGIVQSPKSSIPLMDAEKASLTHETQDGATQKAAQKLPLPALAQAKPIIFDMESVTVSARLETIEELEDFIGKLEKLKPLLPSRR